ncbi:MAG: hypothetical protein A2W35_02025 [Chloroflexi bacterium RBG_16_57_11]|nr:MAG: hypothetical protein A2W35_02025 [Chloroflexi bacterium RBG_16_57_11]
MQTSFFDSLKERWTIKSSEMMHISTTSAISLAVGSSLIGMPGEAKLHIVQINLQTTIIGFLTARSASCS